LQRLQDLLQRIIVCIYYLPRPSATPLCSAQLHIATYQTQHHQYYLHRYTTNSIMHAPDEPIIASEDTATPAGSTLETIHDNQPGGDDHDAIIQAQDRTDADLISSAISNEAEEARAAAGGGEVMIDGAVGADSLKKMKSLYVMDADGIAHHKRSIAKLINTKVKLKKSFDRTKRVRDEARTGHHSSATNDNAVTRAFRFSHNTSAGVNVGADTHNCDDYCCVLIKSPDNGRVQMVIAKFQRFGNAVCNRPLELTWPRSKSEYRASVIILKVVECFDTNELMCIRSTGDIVAQLKCVHSSCFSL
jgi:hypothetical protein